MEEIMSDEPLIPEVIEEVMPVVLEAASNAFKELFAYRYQSIEGVGENHVILQGRNDEADAWVIVYDGAVHE